MSRSPASSARDMDMTTNVRRVALMILLFATASVLPSSLLHAGAGVDYCALFTTKQIEAALGKAVKAGHVPELTSDACRWDAADGKGVVDVLVYPAGIWNDLSGHSRRISE